MFAVIKNYVVNYSNLDKISKYCYTRVVRKLLRQYRSFDKYATHLLHYWQKQ